MQATKLIFLNDIDIKGSPKVRAEVRDDVVEEYAQLYKSKTKLPDPHLYQEPKQKSYLIADGWHRIHGAKAAGLKALICVVHQGSFKDALLTAALCNQTHGLRRSNADKRACVTLLLKHFPELSSREIADKAGVSHEMVASTKKELIEKSAPKDKPEEVSESDSSNTTPKEDKKNESSPPEPEPPKPKVELDETGCAIPKAIQPLWDRQHELQELMTAVSKVKCKVQELYKAHDPLVAWVESQSVIPQLEGAYFSLSEGRLHALCLVCQGHPETKEGGCAECKNTGFLNKKFYEMGTNTKLRDFRERSIKLKEQRANKTA